MTQKDTSAEAAERKSKSGVFVNWAKEKAYDLGVFTVNGKFQNFVNPETDNAWLGFSAAWDFLRAQLAEPEIDVSILTMKLSGNREEHFVRISRGGRTIETGRYDGPFLNRALYERDRLRHVLLGEPKPDLMDEKYADPQMKGGDA